MFNKKTKLRLTDFECNLLIGGTNEFRNMIFADGITTQNVDELLSMNYIQFLITDILIINRWQPTFQTDAIWLLTVLLISVPLKFPTDPVKQFLNITEFSR